MIQYKTEKIDEYGTVATAIGLFGKICYFCVKSKKSGWFRLFGYGMTWAHNSIPPMFSERIGKTKRIVIGNYRYGYLKPKKYGIKNDKRSLH